MGNLFDDNESKPTEIDPDTAFSELVGEGKKYRTAADLAKAYFHLEVHTGTIEQENAALREKTQKASTIEEILERLGQKPSSQEPPTHKTHDSGADDIDVADLVKSEFERLTSVETAKANKGKVKQALVDAYGPRAAEQFKAMQAELGIDLEQLAATSPQLVLKLIGQHAAPSNTAPDLSGTRRQDQSSPSLTTRKGIEETARKEGWSRDRKYKMLHVAMDRAIKDGRLDEFNS